MQWKGLHAIRWGLNSKVGVDSLSGLAIGLRSAKTIDLRSVKKVLEDVRCALDIALDTLDALNTVGALDALESATGGSLGIAIGGIRDHWIRDCFRNRSFRIYNFTHFFRSSLEGQR